MAIHAEGQAPYAPPSTVIEVIERYRTRGLAEPFTIDVLMRAGVPESLASRTLQALRLLDLVDDSGASTESLRLLARATTDEYKARMAEVVRAAYADVFAFADPAADSVERLEDAFRSYHPRGQRSRAVSLFLGLCSYAGIIDEVPVRTSAPKVSSAPRAMKPRSAATRQPIKQQARDIIETPQQTLAAALDPALAGVLKRLPVSADGWTRDQRSAFIHALTAVVDLLYPVRDPQPVRGELTPGQP
jgi:hypothetical protein